MSGLVAGDGAVVVHVVGLGADVEAALFRATQSSAVYSGPPDQEQLTGEDVRVDGLPNGVVQFFGLGVRPAGEAGEYTPSGPVLRGRPGLPIYVDAGANPGAADGASPATAFPDLGTALSTAAARGGANVWVRDGSYRRGPYFVTPGVHVYGGFGASFGAADRDRHGLGTVCTGPAKQVLMQVSNGAVGGPAAVLGGLRFEGQQGSSIGIDAAETPIELRSVTAQGFADRGFKLRNSSPLGGLYVRVSACAFLSNGADGMSTAGALDLAIHGTRFHSNVQEGLDFDDLIALDGGQSTVQVVASEFFGNGTEGLDLDMAAPLIPGPSGGRFEVSIRGSQFVANGADGALIDAEYELVPGWTSSIEVRECVARGNAGAGVHLDADGPGDVVLHRIVASGNSGDGILVTSESNPGIVVVSASATAGNVGAGMRASLGNKAILASHCVFAGNFAGGLVSEVVESGASSSIAYLQPDPWLSSHVFASVVVSDPLADTFRLAPAAYDKVLSLAGPSASLQSGLVVAGATVELSDDGVARVAQQVSGSALLLDSSPSRFLAPGLLTVFGAGSSVQEDYRLGDASVAAGGGLTTPGGPAVDAGPFGAPRAGELGVADAVRVRLFRPVATQPPTPLGVAAQQALTVEFSAELNTSSIAGHVRAVAAGADLGATVTASGRQIVIAPPPGGWPAQFAIELHAGLLAQDGSPLASPLVLPARGT